jgi:hypothetical protein
MESQFKETYDDDFSDEEFKVLEQAFFSEQKPGPLEDHEVSKPVTNLLEGLKKKLAHVPKKPSGRVLFDSHEFGLAPIEVMPKYHSHRFSI